MISLVVAMLMGQWRGMLDVELSLGQLLMRFGPFGLFAAAGMTIFAPALRVRWMAGVYASLAGTTLIAITLLTYKMAVGPIGWATVVVSTPIWGLLLADKVTSWANELCGEPVSSQNADSGSG